MALLARILEYGSDRKAGRKPPSASFPTSRLNVPALASVPDNICLYAVGDIHGRLDLLQILVGLIAADAALSPDAEIKLVFLGDYIDRGPDSRGVIAYLLGDIPFAAERIFLRGNHEDYLLRFLDGDISSGDAWLQFGGAACLASYGLNPFLPGARADLRKLRLDLLERLPPDQLAFLRATRLSWDCGGYHFVHAGVRPGIELDRQSDADRMWIRDEFLLSRDDFGKMVVHGHSIAAAPDIHANRIGIDTGAYATGHLTCLRLQGAERAFLTT